MASNPKASAKISTMPQEPEQELREPESEQGEEKYHDRTINGSCSNNEHNH
jgi:hypothetical protein